MTSHDQAAALQDAGHLFRAAQLFAVTAPGLARAYVGQLREKLAMVDVEMGPDARASFCHHCSTVLVPGWNCRVRVHAGTDKTPLDDAVFPALSSAADAALATPSSKKIKASAPLAGTVNHVRFSCDACRQVATEIPVAHERGVPKNRLKSASDKCRRRRSAQHSRVNFDTRPSNRAVLPPTARPRRPRPLHQLLYSFNFNAMKAMQLLWPASTPPCV